MLRGETPRPEADFSAGCDDDAALMTAVAGGDRRALAALYDLHAPVLLGICRRMLGDPAAAEDLLHDVFVEVWHHAADYAPSRGSVLVWLTVRTRSRALDRLGRQKRHTRVLERLGDETTEIGPAPAATLVDGARLRALLARLPPELIAVLDLAYFEGLSAAEIGARSGIPIGTVKSRLARAIALLREAIDLPHEDRR